MARDIRDQARKVGVPSAFAIFLTAYGDRETRSRVQSVPGALSREKPVGDAALHGLVR